MKIHHCHVTPNQLFPPPFPLINHINLHFGSRLEISKNPFSPPVSLRSSRIFKYLPFPPAIPDETRLMLRSVVMFTFNLNKLKLMSYLRDYKTSWENLIKLFFLIRFAAEPHAYLPSSPLAKFRVKGGKRGEGEESLNWKTFGRAIQASPFTSQTSKVT